MRTKAKDNITINGETLPYFCNKCEFPKTLNESDKKCNDLCCHSVNNALESSCDGSAYKFTQLINYNEQLLNKTKKWYQWKNVI